jgi:hypothetical protein
MNCPDWAGLRALEDTLAGFSELPDLGVPDIARTASGLLNFR